ncbi:TetR/AcrR family transcriptional regulator [Candidatus Acetothermia bacterium]|nr:TetR/AcrR family transcriptional regulator [Candidatus Acetothermia bacterium]
METKTTKRRAPLTQRGKQTYEKLLRSAERAFSRHGYHRTSIAHICRLSRVANGTFYQYFSSKEEIFVALVKHLTQNLHQALRDQRQNSQRAIGQIMLTLRAYLEFLQNHRRLYQIFREAEFIRLELSRDFYRLLAKRFCAIVQQGIKRGELRSCHAETIAYCLIGLQEFLAWRYVLWSDSLSQSALESAEKLILHGIDSGRPTKSLNSSLGTRVNKNETRAREPRVSALLVEGAETRSRLLQAAEMEFGTQGYHRANVADIARRAGVALGTVYVYFHSKEELFIELIRAINHGLRRASAQATTGLHDRRAIEHAGFRAFFRFISQHRQAYGIVREAEFVNGRFGRWYYLSLGEPYAKGLAQGMNQGELARMPAQPLAYQLMGIGHFLGLRWLIWPSFSTQSQASPTHLPNDVFEEAIGFILTGLGK